MYHQSRESRDTSSKGIAEFYEKALQLDPLCGFDAQGLAIVAAETRFKRLKNAREALDVFAKFDRAIEIYETASTRFYMGHNVPVLLGLFGRNDVRPAHDKRTVKDLKRSIEHATTAQKPFASLVSDKAPIRSCGRGRSSGDGAESKKRRRGKLKRAGDQEDGEEQAAVFSEEDDVEKPKIIRDFAEEVAGPRKKQLSKEILSDTDEEMS
ncbi:hypothetical protein B0H10DRAFT_2212065 [Mycena sp. CBHHK59/15]|nr:hypothetical protein B0H10DRAFT_2212065 [Mycena sp. CBHHK59/15]